MSQRRYFTFSANDEVICNGLVGIATSLNEVDSARFHAEITSDHQAPIDCLVSEMGNHQELNAVLEANGSTFSKFTLTLSNFRGCQIEVFRESSATHVDVAFKPQLKPSEIATLMEATYRELPEYTRMESIDKLLGNELSEFYQARERALTKLENLAQHLITQNTEYRRVIDEDKAQFVIDKSAEIERKTRELETEFEQARKVLTDREEHLKAKVQELDDRESRHVRRQLRKDFKDALGKRSELFVLSGMTVKKRVIVHVAYACLVLITGYIAYTWVDVVAQQTTKIDASVSKLQFWLIVMSGIKATAGVAALVAAIIFYIRWNDSWFKQHADEEFRMKRFELDIDRASWVVEMAMEWKDEKGQEIPPGLVEKLSSGLFDNTTGTQNSGTNADRLLTSLLGSSKKVSVEIPGVARAELDSKGSKRLRDELNGGCD